jgi:hypothetical protein
MTFHGVIFWRWSLDLFSKKQLKVKKLHFCGNAVFKLAWYMLNKKGLPYFLAFIYTSIILNYCHESRLQFIIIAFLYPIILHLPPSSPA